MDSDKKTIILVDDDATNLAVGSDALDAYYDVLTLNSGIRLLRVLEKNIPDLILLDVEMPDMNGYETIKKIKANPATEHVPVIFLTAKSDGESEMKGLSLGAIDYIIKPFSPPLLLKRIEIHLLVEEQQKELKDYADNLEIKVEQKTKAVLELQNALLKTMAELVEFRDHMTGHHIERTQGYLRVLIGALQRNGLYDPIIKTWNVEQVLQSAQLHDVGKIAINDAILRKPGKLTEEEFELIKGHTSFGQRVIDRIKQNTTEKDFLEYARVLAFTHHEKWDGSGYPIGLKGEEIPLLGRIMAIADSYDAIVSERPYKEALSHEEAVQIIKNDSGSHFDPELVNLFLEVADEFKKVERLHTSPKEN